MSTDQFYDGILVRPSCRTHDNEIELWLSKNEVDGKNFLTVFHLSQGHSVIEFTDDIIALIKGGQVAANVMLFVPERCHLWQDQDKIEPHFESIQNRMMNHLAVAGFDDATVTLVHLEQPDTEIEVPYQAVVIIPPCTNHQQFLATHLEELGNRGVDPDNILIASLMGVGFRMYNLVNAITFIVKRKLVKSRVFLLQPKDCHLWPQASQMRSNLDNQLIPALKRDVQVVIKLVEGEAVRPQLEQVLFIMPQGMFGQTAVIQKALFEQCMIDPNTLTIYPWQRAWEMNHELLGEAHFSTVLLCGSPETMHSQESLYELRHSIEQDGVMKVYLVWITEINEATMEYQLMDVTQKAGLGPGPQWVDQVVPLNQEVPA